MNKKLLKLNGTVNLTEARFAAAAGFDYIGFCFDRSHPGYIAPSKAKEIMDWITGPQMVAEFGNIDSLEETEQLISLLGFEYFQSSNEAIISAYRDSDLKIFSELDPDPNQHNIIFYIKNSIDPGIREKTLLFVDRKADVDLSYIKGLDIAGYAIDSLPEDSPGLGALGDLSDLVELLQE